MIPKLLHYIWIGPYQDSQSCVERWPAAMPNYEIKRWDNLSAKKYINEAIEKFGGIDCVKDKSFTYISDLVRLLILRDHGGIYLDHDMEIIKDLSPIINDSEFTVTFQYENKKNLQPVNFTKGKNLKYIAEFEYGKNLINSDTVNNCFVSSIPNHFFIAKAIEKTLKNHYNNHDDQYAMSDWGVGPSVFTEVALDLGFDVISCQTQIINGVKILASNYLHPVHGQQRHVRGKEYYDQLINESKTQNDLYGIHLHEHYGATMFIEKKTMQLKEWYNNYVNS